MIPVNLYLFLPIFTAKIVIFLGDFLFLFKRIWIQVLGLKALIRILQICIRNLARSITYYYNLYNAMLHFIWYGKQTWTISNNWPKRACLGFAWQINYWTKKKFTFAFTLGLLQKMCTHARVTRSCIDIALIFPIFMLHNIKHLPPHNVYYSGAVLNFPVFQGDH